MPGRPVRPCTYPGCSALTDGGRSHRCEAHVEKSWLSANEPAKRMSGWGLDKARAKLFRENPLCVSCLVLGRVSLAVQRDHIIPLEEGGQEVESNTQALCKECHKAKTHEERERGRGRTGISREAQYRRMPDDVQRSRIPVVMVCGPSGSGKSTYVRDHADLTHDVVIDLDVIMHRLSGKPMYQTESRLLGYALEERNRQLRALANDQEHKRAWFILSAADPDERECWADTLGAKLVVLKVPYVALTRT